MVLNQQLQETPIAHDIIAISAAEGAKPPKIRVIDMRKELADGNRSILSEPLYTGIRERGGGKYAPQKYSYASLAEPKSIVGDTRIKPTYVPRPLAELDELPIRFTQVISPAVATVEDEVCAFLTTLER